MIKWKIIEEEMDNKQSRILNNYKKMTAPNHNRRIVLQVCIL
jgi:hypothetical protein